MKRTSTLLEMFKKSFLLLFCFVSITLLSTESYGQNKNYATVTPPGTGVKKANLGLLADGIYKDDLTGGSVVSPEKAADEDASTYATLTSNFSATLVTGTAGETMLQLKFPQNNNAGTTTFIRVDPISKTGLNLDLLGLVSDLTGLLKNNVVLLDAYAGATTSSEGTIIPAANVISTIVQDPQGNNYIAVTSSNQYNSIRIRLRFEPKLLAISNGSVSLNVYDAYTVPNGASCGFGSFASTGEVTGISLTLADLVKNPTAAADNNLNTASQLQLGLATVGGTVAQTIFFGEQSAANGVAKVWLSVPPSILTINIFNEIKLQAYNGNIKVGSPVAANSLLGGLDLLGLLSRNTPFPVFFSPGAPFDRVQISMTNSIGLGGNLLGGGINIHEAQVTVPKPLFGGLTNGALANVCGNIVNLSVASPSSGITYNLYRKTGTSTSGASKNLIATNTTGIFSDTGVSQGDYVYYIAAQKTGCDNESDLDSAKVKITEVPLVPTVSDLIICSGSPAVLTVTSPIDGYIYNWYAAATGGAPIGTGATFTTTALTVGASYFVEAVNGTCLSPTRTELKVTVNPMPGLVDIITNNITISKGQTATLIAALQVADASSTINWYAAATGGSPIETGNTFTTPALTVVGTKTYYVEVQTAGGCVSPTRVPVSVTVADIAAGLACNVANAQTNGVGGLLCASCGVENPTYAIDADPLNFSSLRLGVSVGGQVYQRLFFPNVGSATDSIRLNLVIPSGLLDASVIGGTTISVIRNGAVVKTYALNDGLLKLSLLSGERYNLTIPAAFAYDAVEIRIAAVVTALTTVDVYGAEVIYANPTIANTGLDICKGADATITATPAAGTTLKWYDAAVNGTLLFSGSEFKPTGLTATTTYYIEVGNTAGDCVNAVRMPVTVNVNPAIVFTASTLAKAAIGSSYSKQITAATGGTPTFNYTVDAGSSLPAGLTMSNIGVISGVPTASGTFTFQVTATDSKGCKEVATITLQVGDALAIGTTTLPNGTTGVLYPPTTLPEATGGTGPYTYTTPDLPPGLTLDPVTHVISGTPTEAGTFPIVVTVTDADGNTVTQGYTIIIRDPLVLATAPLADGTVDVIYPTQILPAATGGVGPYKYTATNLPPGLVLDIDTREITGTPNTAGPYTVAVTVTDGDGKTVTTDYIINVKSLLELPTATLPDGNVNVPYASQPLPSATGGTGPYTYVAGTTPPGLIFDPQTRIISGTPTQSGSFTIPVTVTDADGNKITTTYNIQVIGALSLPTATLANGTVGAAYTAQTIPAVSGGTSPYTYEVDQTDLPPGLTFNTATRVISGTPTLGGSFTFPVTAKDNGGNSTITDYTILVKVAAPVVASGTTCAGQTATLTVTSPIAGVTYNWYASTGTTPIATGTNYTTAALTANTTYYITAVSGTETSPRTTVTVTIGSAPALATVSAGQTISAGQTATLNASTTAGNTINWFATATSGVAVGQGTSFTTPALTTTTTYYVETQNAAGCASLTRAPVTVTVSTGAVNPYCNAANAQVSKIETLLCLACGINNPTGSIDDDPNTFTTINLGVNVAGVGYQKLIFGKQGEATDSIRIDMEIPVGLADINLISGGTITVYNGNTAVKVYPMNSSLLNLQLLSGGNRVRATFPATGVFDAVEIRVGGVATILSNYNIYGATIVYPNPTLATTGQTICAGSTATLTATANGGTTLNWFAAATGGTSLAEGETFTTPALTATTTYYIEVSKAGCANTQRIPVTVTVTPAPTAPVLATVLPVCYGSTASISIDNPVTGIEYKWYTVDTDGTPVFTGSTFVTPALLANTTYYVAATNPGCGVSSRTAVSVTVNPMVALPQVQASATTVGAGQTAILTAGPINPDVTFNWYTTANGTTPVFTGPVYVTPQLMATTTYYVEAKSDLTGCVSTSRVQITINVDGSGSPNPVPCEAAVSQTNEVNGVALLSGVFNAGLAIDNDTKTGSSLVMTVGAVGASVSQRVGFGSISSVGDTVKVLLTAPGKLLSLGVLNSIKIGTYNGPTNNNDAVAINDGLINLELLSGDTQALLTFVPATPFDQVEVSLNAGVAGVLTTVDLNYVQRIALAPTLTVANPTACEGMPVTLTVNNPSSTVSYKWYDATGATEVGAGVSFSPTITANTTYYVAAVTTSGCVSYKTKVDVTVTPAPAVPVLVLNNIETCAGTNVTLIVKDPVAGFTYKWYDSSNIYQADGASFNVPNVTANSTWSVEAVSATCNLSSATKATATITVGALSVPIITPANLTIKSGTSASLVASSGTAGVTFKWYSDAALSTLVGSTPAYQTPVLTNTTAASIVHTFYVTGEIAGGCAANAAATVNVTVLPHVDGTEIPCEPATLLVRGGVDGVALLSGLFNPERAVDDDTETASSLVMPVGALGASVYQHVGFNGLSMVGDTVKLRLTSPGKLLTLAVLPSIEFTTYAGLTSNNDMIVASNPIIKLELLSDNSGGIISFVPQKQFDGVEVRLRSGLVAVLSTLDFNYAQRVLAAPKVSSANVSACEGTGAIINVQNPAAPATGITYTWHSQDGTQVGTGNTFTTITTLTVGPHEFYLRANRNNCASAQTKVIVTILAAPAAPVEVTGNPTTACPNTPVILAVEKVAGITFKWYDAAIGGNQLASNTDTYTTPANLAPGVHEFFVEASNTNSCISTAARTKVTLTVSRLSSPADITVTGAELAICKDNKVTLTASSVTVTNPIFTWYSDAALTDAVFTGPVYAPTVVATTKFYVSISGDGVCNGGAANAKVVTVVVNPPATLTDLNVTGNTAPFCAGAKATLTARSTTVANPIFTWYSDVALTDVVFTGSVYEPIVTATTTFYVTVSGDNKCPNLAADAKVVTVIVNDIATAADIIVVGNGAAFCNGTVATLTATSTTVTNPTFTWFSDADLKTEIFRGAVYKPIITVSTNYYVIVSGTNKCPNDAVNAKMVAITVNPVATSADITVTGDGAPFCKGTKAILTVSSTTVTNPVFTWYTDANLTNAVFTGDKFEPVVNATFKYYVTVRGDNKCENLSADAKVISLVVNPPAVSTDITVTGNDAPFCNGTKALLTAGSTTVSSPVFTWYTDVALTTVVHTGPVFEPTVTATKTYYVTVSGSDKCANLAGDAKIVSVIVNPPAVATDLILSGADLPICAGATIKLTAASTTVTNPVFTWYTDAALTNAVFTGAVLEKVLTTTTTYYVTVKGANKCENLAGTAKVINVTVNANPDAPIVNNGASLTICAGDGTTLTVQNPQTGVTYQWFSAITGGTLMGTGTSLSILTLNTTTDYYVQATSTSGCGNATGRVKVTVMVSPKPGVPTVGAATVNTCLGSTATLSVTGAASGITYNWFATATSTAILGTGTQFTTPVTTAVVTTYYVEATSGICTSTSRTPVVVNAGAIPLPPSSVSGAEDALCQGSTTVLTVNNVDAALKYTWYTSATGGTGLADGTTFNVPALSATTIYYVGSSNAASGCVSATRTAVTVTVSGKLDAPVVTTQSATATSITFAWPAVTGATAYEVSEDNGLNWKAPSSGAAGTTHLISGLKPDQKVTIRVRAAGQLACQLSDATTFTGTSENPLGNDLFVPNTFTPNNDGQNDVLYVYGNTIAKMQLRVYSQWGQFIYESLNIQNGWDGTYKGQMQPNGVYVYYLEVEFNDGTKATKKGTITLLR